jgi:hypothetical protein
MIKKREYYPCFLRQPGNFKDRLGRDGGSYISEKYRGSMRVESTYSDKPPSVPNYKYLQMGHSPLHCRHISTTRTAPFTIPRLRNAAARASHSSAAVCHGVAMGSQSVDIAADPEHRLGVGKL